MLKAVAIVYTSQTRYPFNVDYENIPLHHEYVLHAILMFNSYVILNCNKFSLNVSYVTWNPILQFYFKYFNC